MANSSTSTAKRAVERERPTLDLVAPAPNGTPATNGGPAPASPRPIPVQPEPFGKRLIDLGLGTGMLVLSSPAWAAIALAIKVEDRGPILYRQERWGRGGHRFHLLKFRTMIRDSDARFGVLQARDGDPRITRVGRFLRRFGLDELPQILSIVRGDMSFVGPRPLAVGEIVEDGKGRHLKWETYEEFRRRLSVRPGLTSLATIFLPKDTHPRRKFRYDLLYVRRQSLALDLRLIAWSFWISFRGRWETRGEKL